MLIISHRGNLFGKNPELENKPHYILGALEAGFDVEIDIWRHEDALWLGHDRPETRLDSEEFLMDHRVWCHAKNVSALHYLLKNNHIHCFFHQTDDVTLTSKGYVWTYPGKEVTPNAICLFPETFGLPDACQGICTDFPNNYK